MEPTWSPQPAASADRIVTARARSSKLNTPPAASLHNHPTFSSSRMLRLPLGVQSLPNPNSSPCSFSTLGVIVLPYSSEFDSGDQTTRDPASASLFCCDGSSARL